jgi:2-polyprenyl-3-methyl-5-hydroxy-6-metoxy-1,4-benzoquinol methylase
MTLWRSVLALALAISSTSSNDLASVSVEVDGVARTVAIAMDAPRRAAEAVAHEFCTTNVPQSATCAAKLASNLRTVQLERALSDGIDALASLPTTPTMLQIEALCANDAALRLHVPLADRAELCVRTLVLSEDRERERRQFRRGLDAAARVANGRDYASAAPSDVAATACAAAEAETSAFRGDAGEIERSCVAPLVRRIEAARMTEFTSRHSYDDITRRRLAHLDSLGLPLQNRSVLELGAGVGELTGFWLAKGCAVLTSDGRVGNVLAMQKRFGARIASQVIDLRSAETMPRAFFSAEIVFCYGLLYHLPNPAATIAWIARHTIQPDGMFLLSTMVGVSRGGGSVADDSDPSGMSVPEGSMPSQAIGGVGTRPRREWILAELRKHFAFVYVPRTQPDHAQFPLEWAMLEDSVQWYRAVFVATHAPIANPGVAQRFVLNELPSKQVRCKCS